MPHSPRCSSRLIVAVVVLLAVGAFLAEGLANAAPARGDEASTPGATPLLAGETEFVAEGEFSAVGFVLFSETGCTGTLIASLWVLTAAHCVPEGGAGGSVFLDITDARNLRRADAIGIREVVVHPDYLTESSSLRRISHDLALLKLDRPAGIQPLVLAPSALAARHGSVATMLGFGDVCDGCGADDRLRMGSTAFLGDRKNSSLARAFRKDLDLVAFTSSDDLNRQAGICSGDSGGPVLGEIDGHTGVVAVLSHEIFVAEDGNTVSCGGAGYSFGVHVEVAAGTPNANWIFSTIGERPTCAGLYATIVGTSRADVLRGTRGRDVIVGGAGDDHVSGGAGRDIVCGGPGDDTLRGDAGADILRGGGGADVLAGNAGRDRCIGDSSDAMAGCERRTVSTDPE